MGATGSATPFLAPIFNDRKYFKNGGMRISLPDMDKIQCLFCRSKSCKCVIIQDYASEYQERITLCEWISVKRKNAIDRLASVSYATLDSHHKEASLNGLLEDYDTFILSVNSRSDVYTVEEIESLLLAQEARLEKHSRRTWFELKIYKYSHTRKHDQEENRGENLNSYIRSHHGSPLHPQPNCTRSNFQNNRGRHQHSNQNLVNRAPNSNRGGRNHWKTGNINRPQWQVCGKNGHIAFYYWHIFDQDYRPSSSSSQLSMSAMVATPYTAFDPKRYPDSGATNHMTPDANNLTNKTNYNGTEQIFVGDGTGLNIHHISSSSFHYPFNSKILILKQLWYVPFITKNLLSLSNFAADNRLFFEFHPNHCYVKDQVTSIHPHGKTT